MKKLVVIGLLVVGGLWVCKKTNVGTYVSTLVARGEEALEKSKSRGTRLDEARRTFDKLDADFRARIGPVAERKITLKELEARVKADRARLEERRGELLELARLVKSASNTVTLTDGTELTLDEARGRLAAAERAINQLENQEKRLAEQRERLRRDEERLKKEGEALTALKDRLDRASDDESSLALSRPGSSGHDFSGAIARFVRDIEKIEREQGIEHQSRDLYEQFRPQGAARTQATEPAPDVRRIEGFFGTAPATKVAQNN